MPARISDAKRWLFKPLSYGLMFYVGSGHAAVDIFNQEGIEKGIAISHDWGSRVISRIANYYPERLSAFAFLAVAYGPPASAYADPITQSKMIKEMLFETNFDSFFSLLFPNAPGVWKDWHICVDRGAQRWIESKNPTPLALHITPEEPYRRKSLLAGGLTASFCGLSLAWVGISLGTAYNLNKPVLFVAFTKDDIGLPLFGDATLGQYAQGPMTRAEVAGDHWAVVSHAPEINDILVRWIKALDLRDN
ncbi:hypothetical protein C8J56DRAFT_1062928 [Mycena floridula]|nr:hypothetical protein C8J56DRAFT_1062928 [Mycena floridula]